MTCKNCGKDRHIVNKFFGLCQECNNLRLHGSKYGKQYQVSPKQRKPLKAKKGNSFRQMSERAVDMIKKDEEFYEKCFNNSNHRCEECDARLNDVFRDDEGKVACRWRYSHILAKSIAPEFRHNLLNINSLCFLHHQQWEFGDKKSMKIYEGNQKRIKEMKHGK